ncbi:MAG: DUF2490 domain-containing protein [Chlorobi bacterium]|nr:DUF2490 domain-containing protein [Chlorobiota bacterium]
MKKKFSLRTFFLSIPKCFFLFLFLWIPQTGHAQYADLWSWNYVTLTGKISPAWEVRLSEELRYDDPFSDLAKYFTQAELIYSPVKFLTLEGTYRNIRDRRKDGSWEKLHRLHFSVEAGKKFGRFSPAYRLRWQNYPDAWNSDKTTYFYLRHKLSLKWDIPNCKINPEFSAEFFHRFNDNRTNELATLRFSIKSSYKFNQHHRIIFGLHKQYEYDEKTPENAWIIRIGYRYDLF